MTKLKLVANGEKPVKKSREQKKPVEEFTDINERLPSPWKHILIEYSFNYRKQPESLGYTEYHAWDIGYASGKFSDGKFKFSDKTLNQRSASDASFAIKRWKYLKNKAIHSFGGEPKKKLLINTK
jgi:hypothetical protein